MAWFRFQPGGEKKKPPTKWETRYSGKDEVQKENGDDDDQIHIEKKMENLTVLASTKGKQKRDVKREAPNAPHQILEDHPS